MRSKWRQKKEGRAAAPTQEMSLEESVEPQPWTPTSLQGLVRWPFAASPRAHVFQIQADVPGQPRRV